MLKEYDLLAMPTTPGRAQKYRPGAKHDIEAIDSSLLNTCAFSVTGNPSLSVPVQTGDDLPVD